MKLYEIKPHPVLLCGCDLKRNHIESKLEAVARSIREKQLKDRMRGCPRNRIGNPRTQPMLAGEIFSRSLWHVMLLTGLWVLL